MVITETVADSHLLLRLKFAWHFSFGKSKRIERRHSSERALAFAEGVRRIQRVCWERNLPLVLGFLKWKNRAALPELDPEPVILDVQTVVKPFPRIDSHLTPPAYAALAELLCDVISNGTEGCRPEAWARGEGTAFARRMQRDAR